MTAPAAAADPHAGHAVDADAGDQTGADLAVGDTPAPPVIHDNMADQVFDPGAMQRARSILQDEHGGARVSKVQADLLEWAPKGDRSSWEVEGWYGGDTNRFAFKTEGEGQSGAGVESAEVQLLYSRAVARYTDVQAGIRYDLEPRGRAYATVGVDALFPYWFEAEGALFLSDKGDLLARLEGSYDFRLTQRLILQPRSELEFAAQDIPESRIGSGLSRGEFGLRLRYEVRREFAPYVGVSYERGFGDTADFVRAHGEKAGSTRFVVGLRAWF
jgi:copper resistance protein B